MRAILVAGGFESEKILEYINGQTDIICADSGYDYVKKMGITPDIVIGDMDSVKSEINAKTIVYPTKKDFTDSELIMEYAAKKGYDELYLFGFIGTRMDHTLTNLFLLFKYWDKNIVIIDDNNEIRPIRRENVIYANPGDIISIVPIGGDIVGVTGENLEYPLENTTIKFCAGLGVSNKMTDKFCRICIKSGKGFLIKSKD